eukprot:TRINITY_DN28370_c1_g1_i4.p1 TRINITY_DN28370_c1_g1~~TRINITY_DN28370_c1_g1_i4.p1  ORF type:complete len:198 (-),score=11.35 TRINITY_DN28370_c1_g1_i4:506-1027(-)
MNCVQVNQKVCCKISQGSQRVKSRVVCQAGNGQTQQVKKEFKANPVQYDNLLLTIMDNNPYLSEGTQQAILTTSEMAKTHKSKLTVLVLDEEGQQEKKSEQEANSISWYLQQAGCSDYSVLYKAVDKPSVVIGDMADESGTDLVIMSSDAIHTKRIDANLLAEFVPCPVLMLP